MMQATTRSEPIWRARLARGTYSLAWIVALPIAIGYLLWRSRRQPEYRAHWAERFARFDGSRRSEPSPQNSPLIWVHAVSVGETRAAEPLIKALLARWPQHRLLLTHMTPTGRAAGHSLYVESMPEREIEQAYLPYDLPVFTHAFLRHYQPAVGVVMETELWPNLVAAASAHKMPLIIANARLSEKSLARGLRFRALLAPALEKVTLAMAQTEADAKRMTELAPVNVSVVGNLKFDVQPDPGLLAAGSLWRKRAGRSVVVFASSREGEEQSVLDAWQQTNRDDVLLVIVPRHPQRFEDVGALMHGTGLPMADRTVVDSSDPQAWQPQALRLLLGNSMGEMPAWYAMADVVLMGGSFLPHGGQNLIEACACGVPVVVGQSTFNFEQAAEQAVSAGAAVRVRDAAEGVARALAIVDDSTQREAMISAADSFARAHQGATALSVEAISALMSD
ncbi:MAG: lipid IV(A) 3-deoxy-D-manno-octulosonic acid transferase [Burkholderiaceae bacterium]